MQQHSDTLMIAVCPRSVPKGCLHYNCKLHTGCTCVLACHMLRVAQLRNLVPGSEIGRSAVCLFALLAVMAVEGRPYQAANSFSGLPVGRAQQALGFQPPSPSPRLLTPAANINLATQVVLRQHMPSVQDMSLQGWLHMLGSMLDIYIYVQAC